eukprot:4777050-Prymnesium_polylepis.1
MTLTVRDFDVQAHSAYDGEGMPCWDFVLIGGLFFCGSSGPEGVFVQAGETIQFSTDNSGNGKGFHICATPPMPPIPFAPPLPPLPPESPVPPLAPPVPPASPKPAAP